MSLQLNFLLFTALLSPNVVSTQSDNNLKFTVVSTTERSQHQHEHNLFEEKLQIRVALMESKLETLDLKINLIQKTLDDLVKLQAPTISKIEEVIEEKLIQHKGTPCEKVGQSEDFNNRMVEIEKKQEKQLKVCDTKLQEVKEKVIEEIKKKSKERAELYEANIEKVKKDIVAAVSTEIGTLKAEIKLFDEKVDKSTKQIVENFGRKITEQLQEESNRLQPTKISTTETPVSIPQNCKEVQEKGNNVTGVYKIQPKTAPQAFPVLCNMETRGGGWTSVLNRFDGSQEFYLNWTDYKQGFGSLNGEFWLGLEHLYEMTGTHGSEILVELADWEGKTVYAHFTNFSIGSEREGYLLKALTGYSGDAGDSFKNHVGNLFSTPDRQQGPNGYCTIKFHGAWWYESGCLHVKLTGKYLRGQIKSFADGIHWFEFHGYEYSLKEARIMIRPA